jgi:hypothetical protein
VVEDGTGFRKMIRQKQSNPISLFIYGEAFLYISLSTKTDYMEVLVFKTNLTDTKRISDIENSLDINPHIRKWNVDLHDCDNILRIEATGLSGKEVENILLNAGYYCEELE